MYYFDESGFTLDPYIPYAWQAPGTVIELPATKGTRINVLGFMNSKNDLHPYMFEQSINTSVVVACLHDFSAISGDLLSAVISTRYILGFRKDNSNVFNRLIQNWLHF